MKIKSTFQTKGYHGYNVKYSLLHPELLACAASENYGLAGRGCLYVLDLGTFRAPKILSIIEWSESLFDVSWSEASEKLIVTGCGDGSVQLWDYLASSAPVAFYKIHNQEVYSVDWNPRNTYPFILSASWDYSLKLWDPFATKEVGTFLDTNQLYEAKFSPHYPTVFSSVSADGMLKLWDIRHPERASGTYPHGSEVLCCDWAKTDEDILAVGTTDGKIIGWDLKNMKEPIFVLVGHDYAIRRLKFAPHERGMLVSVSYDFTTRFWNWARPHADEIHSSHTEFVYGVDFSPSKTFEVCDCSWDSLLNVYDGQISHS